MSSFRRVVSITRPPTSPLRGRQDVHEDTPLLRDAEGSGFSAIADPGGYGSVRFERRPSGKYIFDNGDTESVESDENSDHEIGVKGKTYLRWKDMWPICTGLWTAVFCSALSTTIVANLQLEIGSHFKAGALASWLGTAFLLGLAGVSPLCGRLSQIIGRKGALMLNLVLFLAGTIACAVAPTMYTMLFARAVAGAGSGGLLTITAIILSDLVSPADRGLYQGGGSVVFGAGSAAGAVIGGAVAEEWGWRDAFWVQVLPIVVATLIVWWQIDLQEGDSDRSLWRRLVEIDWAGSGLIMLPISCLTIASSLVTNIEYGPYHPVNFVLFGIAAISLPMFVWIEARAKEPILPLELLTQTQPALVFVAFLLLTATWFARMYLQPVYLQLVRGVDVLESGVLLIPFSVVSSSVSLYAGWHMRYWREYKWFQVITSMFAWIQAISIVFSWSHSTNLNRIMWELCLGGITGIPYTTLITALILAVPPDSTALAISTCYLFRAIGQVLGVSISASIQQSILVSSLHHRLSAFPDMTHLVWEIVEEPTIVIPQLPVPLQYAARAAYMDSIKGVFGFVVLGGVLMTGVCIAIRPQSI